jgi:acetyl esterase/lipase
MRELTRRHFVRSSLAGGAALSAVPVLFRGLIEQTPQAPARTPTITATAVTQTTEDKYAYVDPELIPFLRTQTTLFFDQQVLAEERKHPASFPALPAPAPQPYERRIPGPTGAPDLRIVIVDPLPGAKNRPAFLNIHGGGYIAGFAGWNPPFIQTAAMSCGCVVVSPDYRLAPETPFPGSLEDNYATLRWLYHNADTLGVDRTRIAIGGESAGGGHSAALAITARDRKEFPIMFQLLIYPMLDDRTGSTRPVPPHIGRFVWNATSNRFGWSSLLGVPAGSATVPTGAVPARTENLFDLPPAFISVGSIDLFVDEDIEYAHRLNNAGVPTELHVTPGAFHGYDLLAPDARVSKRFTESWKVALSRAFTNR